MAIGIDFEPVREKIQCASRELKARLTPAVSLIEADKLSKTFNSVAIIGAEGRTGELFTRALSSVLGVEVDPVIRGCIGFALQREPELVILATPNPTENALKEIEEGIKNAKRPFTLVLPQNGIDVVPTAEAVLKNSRDKMTMVRASLFTNVSRGEDGGLVYNEVKNRIALAPVDRDCEDSLKKSQVLFEQAGFDVEVMSDYTSMEWTKLIANRWTADTAVTLLDPRTTLRDRRLFATNLRGLKDGLAIMGVYGIPFADIKWVKSLKLLASLPEWISWIAPLRWYVAHETAAGRNNQPSAAASDIKRGLKKVEATTYYHQVVNDRAEERGMYSPYDRAIFDLLRRNERVDFSINSLRVQKRKNLLLEIFDLESRPVYISSSRFIKSITEGWFKIMSSWFGRRFEVSGLENLQAAAESLEKDKSILVVPNHRGNPDHIAQGIAVRQALGERIPLIIVAGMLFENELLSRMLGRAYDRLLVWTVKNDTDEEEKFMANIINRRSDRMRDQLFEIPRIWIVYLEGGRAKPKKGEKPQLQKPVKGGSLWLKNQHFGKVVSAVNIGTEKMQRPGRVIPWFANVYTRFGIPRSSAYFRDEGAKEPQFAKRDRYIPDIAMRDIAAMLPEDERGGC